MSRARSAPVPPECPVPVWGGRTGPGYQVLPWQMGEPPAVPGRVQNSACPFNRYNEKYPASCMSFSSIHIVSFIDYHSSSQIAQNRCNCGWQQDNGEISACNLKLWDTSLPVLCNCQRTTTTLFFATASSKSHIKLKYSNLNTVMVYLNKFYYCQLQCMRLDVKQIRTYHFQSKRKMLTLSRE